jgi:nucleoside recognition membrane protein YjiH
MILSSVPKTHAVEVISRHLSRISAFFRPADLDKIRDIFVRPFHPDLWAAVVSTWLVLAFFMILFSVIRKRYGLHVNTEDGSTEPDFINDSFIWALATACQQGKETCT